ncbi:MAG: hypothetical protein WCJ58_02115 [bacterium]
MKITVVYLNSPENKRAVSKWLKRNSDLQIYQKLAFNKAAIAKDIAAMPAEDSDLYLHFHKTAKEFSEICKIFQQKFPEGKNIWIREF